LVSKTPILLLKTAVVMLQKNLIVIDVQDNTPPKCRVHSKNYSYHWTGTQSPGENLAKVFASSFDNGSFDNCAPHIYFKVQFVWTSWMVPIMEALKNQLFVTKQMVMMILQLTGSQTYFDDNVKFCCADAGNSIRVVFRVFDVDPGVGPITPSRMNSGGDLFGRYSDCMVEVEVQEQRNSNCCSSS
jgi:hypothetical protein